MLEFVATAAGKPDSWLANLLLDVSAALAGLMWLVFDLLLSCHRALISAHAPPLPDPADAAARGGGRALERGQLGGLLRRWCGLGPATQQLGG